MTHRILLIILFFPVIVYAEHTHAWDYGEYGPDVWSETFSSCGGQLQSPINILTACTTYKNFKPFKFASSYNERHNFTLKNNGHTIIGTFNNESDLSTYRFTGGDLNGSFEFVNFHLHWGENHKSGSEHEVNGIKYPGEIHFVHSNPATNQIAVLGLFMESSFIDNKTENNTVRFYEQTRYEWQRFFDKAQTLVEEDDSIVLNLNLALLMGDNLQDFWRYEGSLTTPPCTEGIIWTIFKQRIIFVESEFKSFRKNVYFEDYRAPQPLYNRTIYRNFLNEILSPVPDYNCCPRNDRNSSYIDLRSSFELLYCSTDLIFFILFTFFIVF